MLTTEIEKNDEIIISTYPRSGSHYLKNLFTQKLDLNLKKTHDPFYNSQNKITIARNPIDSITSAMVMEHRDPMFYTPEKLDSQIELYDNFYTQILIDFKYIINYEVLKTNPDYVVNFFSKEFNKKVNQNKYINSFDQVINRYDKYLITAKSKPVLYNLSKEYFLKQDLTLSWKLYYDVLKIKTI